MVEISLHLCECSYDYGPLYAFWYFSFERMNGVLGKAELKFTINDYLICTVSYISVILFILLGSLSNSHWQIETKIIRRLILDNKISKIVNSGMQTKGLEILKNRKS